VRKPPAKPTGGPKDTIESILIAFILAFVFRAFVVEAFVIPTGSMAPTLLGAHSRIRCDDCGYEFVVNVNSTSTADDSRPSARGKNDTRDDLVIPDAVRYPTSPICPNCGRAVPGSGLKVHYGDRILVLKYMYLFQEPARWDTVVFKAPAEPWKYDYTLNYIKRLVGRPGEQIMLLDGDVYARDASKPDATYIVQTKPQAVQEGLWRIIYDNDYHPQKPRPEGETPWQQPWKTSDGKGWTLDGDGTERGRVFQFDNLTGSGRLTFDSAATPDANHLTEWLAYDQFAYRPTGIADPPDAVVTDLKLDLFYQRKSGDGPLRLGLTKRDRSFVAEISPTRVTLLETTGGTSKELAASSGSISSSKPVHVVFSNVDYQLTVRIDDQPVLKSTPAQYAPDIDALLADFKTLMRTPSRRNLTPLPVVTLEASGQQCNITHLGLFRDIQYTNPEKGAGYGYWGHPRSENLQIKLGKGEYFVLGDNSSISGDARFWQTPIRLPNEELEVGAGIVPARFLLGKAFFVYWPAGFSPISGLPSIAPNFGAMRFIH